MKNIKIEDKYTEFKEEFSESTLKTICAFANTEGGKVFIGIRDDGSVKGVDIDNKKLREITERIVTK